MNAYLTYAAFIGAGLSGIRNQVEPPAECAATATWPPAATGCRARCTRRSGRWRRARPPSRSSAQDVVAHYLNAARVEQQAYDAVVHPWERQRYLERG